MLENTAENERNQGSDNMRYLDKITSRKMQEALRHEIASIPDALSAWIAHYLQFAVVGVRSEAVAQKIALHLARFQAFYLDAYGHDRISTCLKRDVVAWQHHLEGQNLAHATINNHLASLSAFTTWVVSQNDELFPAGDPTKGVGELGLPPLEPRALSVEQVRSLKSVCDRLERFHLLKGRRQKGKARRQAHGRPWRDRAAPRGTGESRPGPGGATDSRGAAHGASSTHYQSAW